MTHQVDILEINPEFSRIVLVSDLTTTPKKLDLVATPEECAALAKRFDIVSINSLKAICEVWRKIDTGLICLKGNVESEVIQSCVVTFAPVKAIINAEFKEFFEESSGKFQEEDDTEIIMDLSMLEDEESAEILTSNKLDIGEIIAQNLALALDPYPRAPDADLTQILGRPLVTRTSPFEGLSEKISSKKIEKQIE